MYPVWEGLFVHSAMFVAIIAAFHVLASHLTVAAAWFNLYLERRAVYEQRPELYTYLKQSALGLMVFAYVFGAMAGVGIWQSTTAANPRGISTLIHNFVLYWGSEWYMFLIDVVGIIAYYYTFGRVDQRTHLRIAWLLALGGTGTLSIIVGILSFKLTPGVWLDTGESLHGFFNPTFWPQLFMRFALMFVITGAWALLIASGLPKAFFEREKIIRSAAAMGLGGFAVALGIWFFWYYPVLPDHAKTILRTPAIPAITYQVIIAGLVLSAAGLLFAFLAPKRQHQLVALGAMFVLFAAIFGAERTREVMRKPDIIANYMSSNQLLFHDMPARDIQNEEAPLNQRGMLGNLPFLLAPANTNNLPISDLPATEQVAVGRVLAIQQCSACHSVSEQTSFSVAGQKLNLRSLANLLIKRKLTTADKIEQYIRGIQGFPYMHAFVGTDEERLAVAIYLEFLIKQQQPPIVEAQRQP
ncbi:MAG: hypothetical protein OHK0050_38410 [Roseiflexaceae bacterium]